MNDKDPEYDDASIVLSDYFQNNADRLQGLEDKLILIQGNYNVYINSELKTLLAQNAAALQSYVATELDLTPKENEVINQFKEKDDGSDSFAELDVQSILEELIARVKITPSPQLESYHQVNEKPGAQLRQYKKIIWHLALLGMSDYGSYLENDVITRAVESIA